MGKNMQTAEDESSALKLPIEPPGVDISGKDQLLRAAASNDAAEFADRLPLSDLNFKDFSGRTALMHACIVGSDVIVRCLLDDKRKLEIDCQDMAGFTALMYAGQRGHDSIVEQLLTMGANHGLRNIVGDTAIILAARRNQVGCLKVLARFVRSPEDWKVYGEFGLTAEQWAEENRRPEAAEFVRQTLSQLNDGKSTNEGHVDVSELQADAKSATHVITDVYERQGSSSSSSSSSGCYSCSSVASDTDDAVSGVTSSKRRRLGSGCASYAWNDKCQLTAACQDAAIDV